MIIESLTEPVPFASGDSHGYLDPLSRYAIMGWVISEGSRNAAFRITAASGRNFVIVNNDRPRPDVFIATGARVHCGFSVPLTEVIDPAELAQNGVVAVDLLIESSAGEVIQRFRLNLSRETIESSAYGMEVRASESQALQGWFADYIHPDAPPTLYLVNGQDERAQVPLTKAPEVAGSLGAMGAWAFSRPLTASFLTRKGPVQIVAERGGRELTRRPVPTQPLIFAIDSREKNVSGWAINTDTPGHRPRITLADAEGRVLNMPACLFRSDLKKALKMFDGFCGFSLPTAGLAPPLSLTLETKNGRVQVPV